MDVPLAEEVHLLHDRLLTEGATQRVRVGVTELLKGREDVLPVSVLAAQLTMVDRRYREAHDLVGPAAEVPLYTAAIVLSGRVSELLGDLPEAFRAYSSVRDSSALADRRAQELFPRTVEILSARVEEALRRGRVDGAEEALARLQQWAPRELPTLRATWQVAREVGHADAELAALKALLQREPDSRLLVRRAELELEVGDPTYAVQILGELLRQRPEDGELEEKLAIAKFRWRIQVLPPEVQQLTRMPELTRGDFARFLYWLVPGVRTGSPAEGRIATDVIDHPNRGELVHVVNLGLMEVDATLHRFEPGRAITREEVLESLIRVLGRSPGPVPCLGEAALNARPTAEFTCRTAVRCGLLDAEADCLREAAVSGAEAMELIRRVLKAQASDAE